jgi:HD-like signal output (HDOD) protein
MLGKFSRWLSGNVPRDRSKGTKLRLVEDPPEKETVEIGAATWTAVEGLWTLGHNAESPSPEMCRARLGNRLSDERDQADNVHDRMFLGQLLQLVGTEDMGLPHFPDTALELDRLLAQEEPDYRAVMRVIESDPHLVGRIWALARSARFPAAPNGLDIAVSRIGMVEVWRLSVQSAVDCIAVDSGPYSKPADQARIHGVLVGKVTAALAKERRGPQFIAGLLHDVGELVVLAAASRTQPSPILVDRIIARYHAAISVLVVHAWRLDPVVAPAVAWHHDPFVDAKGPTELARLVHISDIAVHGEIDRRSKLQSHPELAIKQAAKSPMDLTRPMILAGHSIDRLERDGIQVPPRKV